MRPVCLLPVGQIYVVVFPLHFNVCVRKSLKRSRVLLGG